jgi:hypothetical protein
LTIVMGKRRGDAAFRKFFDEFLCVKIPRLRATGSTGSTGSTSTGHNGVGHSGAGPSNGR